MARVSQVALEQAIMARVPASPNYVTHADLIQQLQDSGNAQAAMHILRMQQTGRIVPVVAKVPGSSPELRYSLASTEGGA